MSTTTVTPTKLWSGGKSPFNVEYGKLMMWYFLMSDAFTFGAFLISYGTIRFSTNGWPDPNEVFKSFPFAPEGVHAPLVFVSIMTFILIISSVTMVLAVHAGHNGNKKGVIKWLAWTIVGGLAFLGCQAWEWHHLITGEHAALVGGKIELIGQTTRHNAWGQLVHGDVLTQALQASSPDVLAHMVSEQTHKSVEELHKLPKDQLLGMLNTAELHVRETGPIAFGGYFFGITGFHGFHVFSGVVINIVMLIMTQKNVFERKGHYLMIEKAGLYWHFVDLVWVFVFLCFYLI